MEKKHMGKVLVGVIILAALCLFIQLSYAWVPETISYQGYLTNASGTAVNGTVDMEFSIYGVTTGGTALWA